MLELSGVGVVLNPPVAKQLKNGGDVVTVEVDFIDRKKDTVKSNPIKCKGFGSSGAALKRLAVGQKILVYGKLEVDVYEWNGKPAKSYGINVISCAELPGEKQQPISQSSQPGFDEFEQAF